MTKGSVILFLQPHFPLKKFRKRTGLANTTLLFDKKSTILNPIFKDIETCTLSRKQLKAS